MANKNIISNRLGKMEKTMVSPDVCSTFDIAQHCKYYNDHQCDIKNEISTLFFNKKENYLFDYTTFISNFTTELDKCINENYSGPFSYCKFKNKNDKSLFIMVSTKIIGIIIIDENDTIQKIMIDNVIYELIKSKIDTLVAKYIGMKVIFQE